MSGSAAIGGELSMNTPFNDSNYVFHLWTSKTDILKHLAELLRDLLTEGNLECTPEGIRIMCLTVDKTSLVHMRLKCKQQTNGDKTTGFEKYTCKETLNLGLNMEDYFKIIKLVEKKETIRYFVTDDNRTELAIQRINQEENICNTKYIKLMDINTKPMAIPDIVFDNVIVMNSVRFQKICKEIGTFSDLVEIKSIGKTLYFRAHKANVKQEIMIKPTNTDTGMEFEVCKNTSDIIVGVYKLKYLESFSKCANFSPTVKIFLQNDTPLIIECEISDLGLIRLCISNMVTE
jgi:proliferating cell nuclear antigen